MKKILACSCSTLVIFFAASYSSARAADLLAYYDFDDATDPAVAPPSGGIAPAAAITAPAVYTLDAGGRSGSAGDLGLDLGTVANSGGFARTPAGNHFTLATATNSMAVSFWQFNVGDGLGGFFASSSFWIDSPTAAFDGRGFQVHVPWSDGTFYFDQSGCCGVGQRLTIAGVVTPGVWEHVVVQRDELGNQEIWLNGVMLASAPDAQILEDFTGIMTIGANGGGTNNLTGVMDEFAVYAGTLTEAEIGLLAAGTSVPSDIAGPPADADNDGLPDSWEMAFGLAIDDDGSTDVNNGPMGDPDMDGLNNLEEFNAGLEPDNDDFDMDGLLDGAETGDGNYVDEDNTGTDPKNADSDGDGLPDGVEDPTLTFVDAMQPGTNPNLADSDGDGFEDLIEIDNDSDPTDINSTPGSDELTLLAYFNFDGQLVDQANNTPDAVLNGNAALTTGGMGFSGAGGDESLDLGALNEGSNAQVPAGTHLDLAFATNTMSVSFWQFNTGFGNSSAFWIHAPTANGGQRGFQAHTPWGDGRIFFDQSGCCTGPQRLVIAAADSTLVTDQWQHLVFQRNEFGDRQIWIDGVLSASAGGAEDFDAFDGIITIGSEGPTMANSFQGRIDDFAIFANYLSPEEITELANGANASDLISPPVPFIITNISHDPDTGATSVEWNSRPNATYAVDSSDDMTNWSELDDGVESEGETTSYSETLPIGTTRKFYRAREL